MAPGYGKCRFEPRSRCLCNANSGGATLQKSPPRIGWRPAVRPGLFRLSTLFDPGHCANRLRLIVHRNNSVVRFGKVPTGWFDQPDLESPPPNSQKSFPSSIDFLFLCVSFVDVHCHCLPSIEESRFVLVIANTELCAALIRGWGGGALKGGAGPFLSPQVFALGHSSRCKFLQPLGDISILEKLSLVNPKHVSVLEGIPSACRCISFTVRIPQCFTSISENQKKSLLKIFDLQTFGYRGIPQWCQGSVFYNFPFFFFN